MKIYLRLLWLFLLVASVVSTMDAYISGRDCIKFKRMLDVKAQRNKDVESLSIQEKNIQLKSMLDNEEKLLPKNVLSLLMFFVQQPEKARQFFPSGQITQEGIARFLFPDFEQISQKNKDEIIASIDLVKIQDLMERLQNELAVGAQRFSAKHLEASLASGDINDFYSYVGDPKNLDANNIIRERMAGHWIRNAALRVFSDDLRSFLELVVNARDAMLPPEEAVGKFGMGFFSILSYLAHKYTSGAIITIDTKHQVKDNTINHYKITIKKEYSPEQWKETPIDFTFQVLPAQAGDKPGTCISITPNKGAFSVDSLRKLREYVHFIMPTEKVAIKINYQEQEDGGQISETIGGRQNAPEILVQLTPKLLSVTDAGTGISAQVALRNLLIPSSSTKGVASLEKLREAARSAGVKIPELIEFGGKSEQNCKSSYFLIIVNDIVVVRKKMESTITGPDGKVKDIAIKMPQATQLTLARDELAILPNEESFEETWLTDVIKETINKITAKDSKIPFTILMALYRGLQAWEEQTALHYIKGKFTNVFKQELELKISDPQSRVVAVPSKHFEDFLKIFKAFGLAEKYIFLSLEDDLVNNNFGKLENILIEAAQSKISDDEQKKIKEDAIAGNLTQGTKLIFWTDGDEKLLDGEIKSFSLRSVLFVPQSLLDEAVNEGDKDQKKIQNRLFNKLGRFNGYPLLTPDLAISAEQPMIISTISDDITWKIDDKPLVDFYMYDFYCDVFTKSGWPTCKLDRQTYNNYANQGFLVSQVTQNLFKNQNDILVENGYSSFNDSYYMYFPFNPEFKRIDATKTSKELYKFLIIKPGDSPRIVNPEKSKDESIPQTLAKFLNGKQLYNFPWYSQKSVAEFRSFILFSLLYRFGITSMKTEGSLFLCANGKQTQIWPISQEKYSNMTEADIDELILMLLPYTYGDVRLIAMDNNSRGMCKDFKKKTIDDPVNFEGFCKYYADKDTLSRFLREPVHSFNSPKNEMPVLWKKDSWWGDGYQKRDGYKCTVPSFVGLKGEKEIEKKVKFYQSRLQKAAIYQVNLRDVIKGLPITQFFVDLARIEDMHQEDQEIKNMIDVAYALYDKYFAIKDSDLPIVQGKATSIDAIRLSDDVTAIEAADFLRDFTKSDQLSKLVALQKEDFREKTDLDARAEDLKTNQLFVPSFLSNTPISVLTYLSRQGVGIDTIAALVKYSRSSDELLFITHLLLQGVNFTSLDKDIVKNLLENYIQKRVSKEKRRDVALKNRVKLNLSARLETFKGEESLAMVQEFFKNLEDGAHKSDMSAFYNKYHNVISEKDYQFTLKKLMKAHAVGAGLQQRLEKNDLDGVLNIIRNTRGEIEGNKIMQCVEVGSERSPLQASIVETLQNSLDVVKAYNKRQVDIINLAIGQIPNQSGSEKSSAYYSIKDAVGMPSLENLLADIIIPDYSRKSPATNNIGDMGNGFFQLFKDAEEVLVITRITNDPTKIFILQIIPWRNKDGLVEDLKLRCVKKEPKDIDKNVEWYGTYIAIKYLEQDAKITTMNLLTAKDFIHNCVGATNVTMANGRKIIIALAEPATEINGPKINNLDQYLAYIDIKLKSDRDNKLYKINIYKRNNPLLDSYITTGGVPFGPLGEFLREENFLPLDWIPLLNSGLVVDLPLGSYQPVQSRTHLKMSEENKKNLREFFLEFVYWHEIQRIQDNKDLLDYYFENFNSEVGNFDRVSLSLENKQNWDNAYENFLNGSLTPFASKKFFFTNYKPKSGPQKSFYQFITEGYKKLINSLNQEKQKKDNEILSQYREILKGVENGSLELAKARSDWEQKSGTFYRNWFDERDDLVWFPWTRLFDNVLNKSKPTPEQMIINKIIIPWFKKKVAHVKLDIPLLPDEAVVETGGQKVLVKTEEKKQKELEYNGAVNNFTSTTKQSLKLGVVDDTRLKVALGYYLSYYVTSFFAANKKKNPPKIEFVRMNRGDGMFAADKISINIDKFSIADILEHLLFLTSEVRSVQDANALKIYKDLFGCGLGTIGMVTQLLEYAREPKEVDDNKRTFDENAKYYANKAIGNGCLELWVDKVKKIPENTGVVIDDTLIKSVRELERIDKERLVSELGFGLLKQ